MSKKQILMLKNDIRKNQKIVDNIETNHNVNINPVYSHKELMASNNAQGIINNAELKLASL